MGKKKGAAAGSGAVKDEDGGGGEGGGDVVFFSGGAGADEQSSEEELMMDFSKKKKKKGAAKKKKTSPPEPALPDEHPASRDLPSNGASGEHQDTPDYSTKRDSAPPAAGFAALAIDEPSQDVDDEPSEPAMKTSGFAALAGDVDDIDEDNDDIGDDIREEPAAAPHIPLTPAQLKKQKKKSKKAAPAEPEEMDEDLDALLAELDGPAGPPAPSALAELSGADDKPAVEPEKPLTAAQKKKLKKKAKKKDAVAAVENEQDLDELLAELDGPDKPVATESHVETQESEQVTASNESAADSGPVELTAAQKKKLKKKAKKAEASKQADVSGEPVVAKAPPKKKESAIVRKAREAVERQKAEEERLRKAAEEAEAKALAEEKRLEEEAKRKEEESARKKEAQRLKKEQLRKEGKLLSKKEKEAKRRAEIARQQFEAAGLVANSTVKSDQDKPKKPVYTKKRGKKPPVRNNVVVEEVLTAENRKIGENPEVEQTPTEPEVEEPMAAEAAWDEEDWETKIDELAVVDEEEDQAKTEIQEEQKRSREAQAAREAQKAAQRERAAKIAAGLNGQMDDSDEFDSDSEVDSESGSSESGSESEACSDSSYYESSSGYDSDDVDHVKRRKAKLIQERIAVVRSKREELNRTADEQRSPDRLRSPIVAILGHVDTGKTKILDKIRRTNVQDGEAGGITQQIGATYFPIDAVKQQASKVDPQLEYKVPSVLIIDTPGHESFANLRDRGSSLCDIAILVVDIMHGLEPQTIESIQLLRQKKNPFIVALNKIDRIYDWTEHPFGASKKSVEEQKQHVQEEFRRRVGETQLAFAEQGFNSELYWENPDPRSHVSLVPTSAITGEGIPDLLMLLVSMPQKLLVDRMMFSTRISCTVLEVKAIEGLGTTIDVVLTGGTLKEGDKIVVCGLDGPITTKIRGLLTPHPMKEMRVKGQYLHHKSLDAAQGIKISAEGLEKALAGTQLLVASDGSEDEMLFLKEEVMRDLGSILQSVDKSGIGVYVQASTLGSLEALLEFLRSSKIPVSGINIGPVHKRDITKCSTMLERKKEFAVVLAFDVKVENEAKELADDMGVRIFTADIIYHLFDQFTAYMESEKKKRREAASDDAVFPCILKILPNFIINKRDPIIVGVEVVEGILKTGTPMTISHTNGLTGEKSWMDIGKVVGIERDHNSIPLASKGETVAAKIQSRNTENITYGRHFDHSDPLYSKLSRRSIDLLKENFRDDLAKEDWLCVIKLKKIFEIM